MKAHSVKQDVSFEEELNMFLRRAHDYWLLDVVDDICLEDINDTRMINVNVDLDYDNKAHWFVVRPQIWLYRYCESWCNNQLWIDDEFGYPIWRMPDDCGLYRGDK